jgi:hypothetical protein
MRFSPLVSFTGDTTPRVESAAAALNLPRNETGDSHPLVVPCEQPAQVALMGTRLSPIEW